MLGRLLKRRKRDDAAGPQVCIVAMRSLDIFNPAAVTASARKLFPNSTITYTGTDESVHSFECDGATVMIIGIPAPIPEPDCSEAARRSWMWPEAATAIKAQKAHVIVTALGGEDAIETSMIATQVAAAICDAADAVAVYWGNAGHLVEPQHFIETATDDEVPPISVWVGLVLSGESDSGPFTLSSCGMPNLGFMELEIIDAHMPAEELIDQAYSIVAYLVQNGPILKHGHTFGPDPDTKYRVEHAKSKFRKGERVLRLHIP